MRKNILYLVISIFLFGSCQNENITIGEGVSETFYVQNKGASMRVLVEGNTASKVILLVVHGGPGASSYVYNNEYFSKLIEPKYAVAYWDQRIAGASQGGSNLENHKIEVIIEDLKEVILTLKSRYGNDFSIFLCGHSFGGMPTAGFLVEPQNQDMVKGWIFANASHNYKLNDKYTHDKLVFFANDQINKGKKVEEWKAIKKFCDEKVPPFSFDQSFQLNIKANQTLNYFDEFSNQSAINFAINSPLRDHVALTSAFINLYVSQKSPLNKQLWETEYSSKLSNVKIPLMTISGYFDSTCPTELSNDVYLNVSSVNKERWESPKSGHNIMDKGNDPEFFCEKVNGFIAKYK
ncbi:MAG: alpha/beta hydrolase [Leadbetterella sp.]